MRRKSVLLSPVMLILAVCIKLDSKGPVFYRQERVTQYGKKYRIFKFRTMVADADKKGPLVTTGQDSRITRMGNKLRKCRLDELPQLFNVLTGDIPMAPYIASTGKEKAAMEKVRMLTSDPIDSARRGDRKSVV